MQIQINCLHCLHFLVLTVKSEIFCLSTGNCQEIHIFNVLLATIDTCVCTETHLYVSYWIWHLPWLHVSLQL